MRLSSNHIVLTATLAFISAKTYSQDILEIPVVVHVVYNQEEENISDAQIRSQIIALNKDFRRLNEDRENTNPLFQDVAADVEVEFYLAGIDDQGLPFDGIIRKQTSHGVFGNSDIHYDALGGSDVMAPDQYLNIWVCRLAAGTNGFASSPGGNPDEDGVVINFQFFGTEGNVLEPYHLGRTATHESGHYLGLNHTWGISGGCGDDDGIEDTPLQATSSDQCDTEVESCGSVDMAQNFMDLTEDACLNLFTLGQKEVMRNTITTLRSGLLEDKKGVVTSIDRHKFREVRFYPNPVSDGRLNITEGSEILRIIDLSGKEIEFNYESETRISFISNGTFLVDYRNSGGQRLSERIIVY